MKRLWFVAFVCFVLTGTLHAQTLPIPNNDTRGLIDSLTAGRPFGQATLNSLEPTLAHYCIALTPPNAAGDRTKIGDPISGRWTRLGFGEGHWVWIPQGDGYAPNCQALAAQFPSEQPPPVVTPPPVVVPPPVTPAPVVITQSDPLAAQALVLIQQMANTQQQQLAVERDTNEKVTVLQAEAKSFMDKLAPFLEFTGKYVLPAVASWFTAKAVFKP